MKTIKTKSFNYLGHNFKPHRKINQKERDVIFYKVCSINKSIFSNYDGGKYNYNDFYEVALRACCYEYDTFIIDNVCEVAPCSNELFATSKEEALKYYENNQSKH